MYAHALSHLVANLHRLTPRHAALVRLWHGIAAERGLTAGQVRGVMTIYDRLVGEQGEYAMDEQWIDVNDRLPELDAPVLVAYKNSGSRWIYRTAIRSWLTADSFGIGMATIEEGQVLLPLYWQPITPPAARMGTNEQQN